MQIYACMRIDMHRHTNTYICMQIHAHTWIHMQVHAHILRYRDLPTHALMYVQTQARTHARVHVRMHACMHLCTYVHIDTGCRLTVGRLRVLEPCPTTRPSPASPQPGLHPPLFSTAALDVVRHHLVEAGSVQIQVVWSDRGTACCVSCSSSSAIMLPRRTRHVHAPHSRAGGRRSVAVWLTNSAVSRRSVSPPIEGPWNAQGEAAGPARRNLEESSKQSAMLPATASSFEAHDLRYEMLSFMLHIIHAQN